MASTRTYKGWWNLSVIDDRNQRPLFSAFVHCGLGDGVPLRARLSARFITVFPPSLTARQAMVASASHGR
jgi:hypothetical protein